MATNPSGADQDRTTFWQMITFGCGTAADRRNNRKFTLWCIAWAIAITTSTLIIESYANLPSSVAIVIALIPNAFALGALISYMRFLRMTDELQRKIQVEGLAVGFGVGWIFAIGYLVLQSVGAPALSVNTMVVVMTAGWVVGNVLAIRHYR